MNRGGKRKGAGRKSKLPKATRILIGARVKTLLAEREIVRDNKAIPYSLLESAQRALNTIPVEKRSGYPAKLLRWTRATLDNAGRLVTGKSRGIMEVLEQVAKEATNDCGMPVTMKMVRDCYEHYLKISDREE
jgi:hypothetical protein